LVIDGRVVWVGSVPPRGRLKQWLEEAREKYTAKKAET